MSEGEKAKARTKLLRALADNLNAPDPQGGSLQVLRTGFKNTPATFTMMEKRPEKTSNAKVNARYAANRLRVMREVRYSTKNENRIDLVLFVNGIPVATVAIGNAKNAGILAARILGTSDPDLQQRLVDYQAGLAETAHAKGKVVREASAGPRKLGF